MSVQNTNMEGLTIKQWAEIAGVNPKDSAARKAWNAGEDPTSYRAKRSVSYGR